MPIPLSLIPEHLRLEIVKKQGIREFANFSLASREGYNLAKIRPGKVFIHAVSMHIRHVEPEGTLLYFYLGEPGERDTIDIRAEWVPNLPINIVGKDIRVEGRLTSEFCEWLTQFITSSNSTIFGLYLERVRCTPDKFQALLEVSHFKEIMSEFDVSRHLLRVDGVEKLTKLDFESEIEDSDLIQLRAPSLTIKATNVTSRGINRLLHEWLEGERQIDFYYITNRMGGFNKDQIFTDIPYSTVKSTPGGTGIYKIQKGPGEARLIKVRGQSIVRIKP